MKKILLLLVVFLTLVACGKKTDPNEGNNNEEPIVNNDNNEEPVPLPEPVLVSKLDGSPLANEGDDDNQRIYAVMFDNAPVARWQAGLSEASIMYEIRVEGNVTRYLGIFQTDNQDLELGPVRSARPYYVQTVAEYGAIYAHHGGSTEGIAEIGILGVEDIDGMNYDGSVYRRKTHKSAPHNSYLTIGRLNAKADELGLTTTNTAEGFIFYNEPTDIGGNVANTVEINYGSNTTKYVYNAEAKTYDRYKDGQQQVDENNNEPLKVANIIIQHVDSRIADNGVHKVLSNIGSGTGYLISNGQSIAINWSKENASAPTRFTTETNEPITLNKGQTWIQWIEEGETNITE